MENETRSPIVTETLSLGPVDLYLEASLCMSSFSSPNRHDIYACVCVTVDGQNWRMSTHTKYVGERSNIVLQSCTFGLSPTQSTITDMLWWRWKREEPTKRRLAVSRQIFCFAGRYLKSDDEYRKLAQFIRHEGVEYKSFMLKSDRPLKLLICGLPTSTKVEEIRVEIEREGFQSIKSPDYKNLKPKLPCR
ncbi:hypothetical protein TNCV_3845811 [Trichonephila clavipes]|nr:hypothetical protein TNCV_3845811 [Trichonephila clavipes]